MSYPDTRLFIDGTLRDGARWPTPGCPQPHDRRRNWPGRSCRRDRSRPRAGCGVQRIFDLARHDTGQAQQDHAAGGCADAIAALLTQEQGKLLGEARIKALATADIIEWAAEEGFRVYGRLSQMVVKVQVGSCWRT